MPFAIDQEALDSPNMKVLDALHPPMKSIPYAEFPKMVYLHPIDKTKEHRTLLVVNKNGEQSALKQGYKLIPHVPTAPPDPAIEAGEFEVA